MATESELIAELRGLLANKDAPDGPYIFSDDEVAALKEAITLQRELKEKGVPPRVVARMAAVFVKLDGAAWFGGKAVFVAGAIGVLIVNWERIAEVIGLARE
jgi:hypothetical protein